MNDQRLRRILRSVLLTAPLPLAILGAACGGTSTSDPNGEAGATSAGAAGSATAGSSSGGSAGATQAGAGGASAGSSGASSAGSAGATSNDCANPGGHPSCVPYSLALPRHCVASDATAGQTLSRETCSALCGDQFSLCSVTSTDANNASVMCNPGCAIGRRPAGLNEPAAVASDALGDYFAQIAHLEAASVTAFRVLRDELRAKGAPKRLVRAAARAARDEVRHARSTGALARRFGGHRLTVNVSPSAPRSLEAMALENAIEGCVRETYGALLATRQAEQAKDPQVRAAMQRIARDETRHAALSWSVGRWLEERLDPVAKRNVEEAKRAAASQLRAALAAESPLGFAELLGLPSPEEAARLAEEMQRTLWS